MDLLILIVRFIGVLGALVLVHEFGHFFAARAFKVKVLEFGLGFPPRLFGFRKGQTLYSINLLPLGGFVKLLGEEDPSDPHSLASKSILQRSVVLTAGVFMNVVLVVVLFTAMLMVPHQQLSTSVIIQEIQSGSPASMSELSTGDAVLRVDGHHIYNSMDLIYRVHLRLGAQSNWEIKRTLDSGSPITKSVTLTPRWEWPSGQGPTGIRVEDTNITTVTFSEPFWEALPHAVLRTWESLILMKNEVTRWVIGASTPQVAGPIGIAQMTNQVAEAGLRPLLSLIAALSLTLAVLNILPIPMLDGGRLVFVLLEWVRRGKRVSPERESLVHFLGFAVLMSLVIIISYQDILRLIQGKSMLN